MTNKIKVGILGATGMVGQKFIDLLRSHPWFEVAELAASDTSKGKKYSERMRKNWRMAKPIPKNVAGLKIKGCDEKLSSKVLFSGLDSSVAGKIEEFYAKRGHIVISNSKNHRMDKDVPLIVPEINADHLGLLKYQKSDGKIITNPNCSTIGMVLALAPLLKKFGIKKITATTLQALSGAGYPASLSIDIEDNIIPYISGEEEKMETEPLKIFGKLENGKIKNASFKISASCTRVNVSDGHTECVAFSLGRKVSLNDVKKALCEFNPLKNLKLPSSPKAPIILTEDEKRPQPKHDREASGGMAVVVGRLRKCSVLDYKMTILSHNTVRGAAGGTILIAELLKAKGII